MTRHLDIPGKRAKARIRISHPRSGMRSLHAQGFHSRGAAQWSHLFEASQTRTSNLSSNFAGLPVQTNRQQPPPRGTPRGTCITQRRAHPFLLSALEDHCPPLVIFTSIQPFDICLKSLLCNTDLNMFKTLVLFMCLFIYIALSFLFTCVHA